MTSGYDRRRNLKLPWILCTFIFLGLGSASGRGREIWLSGVDPYVRLRAFHEVNDYRHLFDEHSGWSRSARSIHSLKISTQYLAQASDGDLKTLLSGLRRRKIMLAMEGLMIPKRAACGTGIEGYSAPGTIAAIAHHIKRLGGTIDAVAMDEPAWFGHHDHGPNTCASTLDQVAAAVAENVRALRIVFPAVRVGDIEPLGGRNQGGWPDDIEAFAHAFQQATGRPLDFFDADLDWNGPWREAAPAMAKRMGEMKIPFGVIFNGDSEDTSDEAWTDHALAHADEMEGELGLVPDRAILQTWMRYPLHMLPEGQPGTMTNLVLRYSLPRPTLTVKLVGRNLSGRLTVAPNRPLPGRTLVLSAKTRQPVPVHQQLDGIVPVGAVRALIGLRLNVECDCSGTIDGLLGPLTYRDGQSQQVIDVPMSNSSAPAQDRTSAAHFVALHIRPGEQSLINSRSFAVQSGSTYNLSFQAGISADSRDAGYIGLIFIDQSGKGLARNKLRFIPTEVQLGDVRTGTDGRFSYELVSNSVAWTDLKIALRSGEPLRLINKTIALLPKRTEASYSPKRAGVPQERKIRNRASKWCVHSQRLLSSALSASRLLSCASN